MEESCLKDKDVYPDDEVLASSLGRAKASWDLLFEMVEEDYPLYATEWRHYRDGKQWLLKVTKKKKTVCWISVHRKYFRVSFYFTDKAAKLINSSGLNPEYKDQFANGKYYGKLRLLSLKIGKKADLKAVETVFGIKEQLL